MKKKKSNIKNVQKEKDLNRGCIYIQPFYTSVRIFYSVITQYAFLKIKPFHYIQKENLI